MRVYVQARMEPDPCQLVHSDRVKTFMQARGGKDSALQWEHRNEPLGYFGTANA